jgi:hypothetical protein
MYTKSPPKTREQAQNNAQGDELQPAWSRKTFQGKGLGHFTEAKIVVTMT